MGIIMDEFKDLIVETEDESLEAASLRLITERKNGENKNMWRLNNMILKSNGSINKSKRESENTSKEVQV